MANPFDDASNLVGELKVEYEKLTVEVPKLRETKKSLVTDVEALNRELVAKQEKLDLLTESIKTRVDTYNTWQEEQTQAIKTQQDSLHREKIDTENEFAKREADIKEKYARLDTATHDLTTASQKVLEDQKDIEAQRASNSAWAARLGVQEERLTKTDSELGDNKIALDNQAVEVTNREARLVAAEQEVADNIKTSDQDRAIAHQILNDAKEKIADNDAREDALKMRGQQLDMREQNLKKMEAGLNDRRNVMIANGTLK